MQLDVIIIIAKIINIACVVTFVQRENKSAKVGFEDCCAQTHSQNKIFNKGGDLKSAIMNQISFHSALFKCYA